MTRVCTHCKREFDISFFSKGKGRDGRHCWCKECMRAAVKKHKEAGYDWAKKYPDRAKASAKAHYLAHREEALQKAKEYRETHKEQISEYAKKKRLENPERIKEQERRSREKNKEKIQARRLADTKALRIETYAAYGGKCEHCGETRLSRLNLDHINNDGAADRRKRGTAGGVGFYSQLKREGFPQGNIRILCWNCNHLAYMKSQHIQNDAHVDRPCPECGEDRFLLMTGNGLCRNCACSKPLEHLD
jgi:hypothetical protein